MTLLGTPFIETRNVSFLYGKRQILEDVSFSVGSNEFVVLIGPNGSGKTTLLQVLLGLRRVHGGDILISGLPLQSLTRKSIAQKLTFLPQDTAMEFAFSVREVVAMGRNPHLGRFQSETADDQLIIERALSATDTLHLASRPITALSGGERQRALLARSIAQQTPLLLLDEPTANLDMSHQIETLQLAKQLVGQGRSVIAAIHDLTLASRYADRAILISQGRIVSDGPPQQVITEDNLARYFHIRTAIQANKQLESGGLIVTPLESLRHIQEFARKESSHE